MALPSSASSCRITSRDTWNQLHNKFNYNFILTTTHTRTSYHDAKQPKHLGYLGLPCQILNVFSRTRDVKILVLWIPNFVRVRILGVTYNWGWPNEVYNVTTWRSQQPVISATKGYRPPKYAEILVIGGDLTKLFVHLATLRICDRGITILSLNTSGSTVVLPPSRAKKRHNHGSNSGKNVMTFVRNFVYFFK